MIEDDGSIHVDHDNLDGAQLATIALVTHDLALKVLKNGTDKRIPERSADGS